MAIPILTDVPAAWDVTPKEEVTKIQFRPEQRRKRIVHADRFFRTGRATFGPFNKTDLNTFMDFVYARGTTESFLMRDPDRSARASVALGTSIAAQTIFTIPTDGVVGGDYPVDNASAILYDDGAPVTKTVVTDSRHFDASVSPTAGSVMTADYEYYLRFEIQSFRVSNAGGALWAVTLQLQEVTN